MEEAIAHITAYGSQHTEAIVTRNFERAHRFLQEVQSSLVLVNASTRFNDGFQLGLGAEIGISTSRLHAFGPMGIEELTTTKFIALGEWSASELIRAVMSDESMPQRVGVMGGTFDPVHLGHLRVAEEAVEALAARYAAFRSGGLPPHKSGKRILPFEHRWQMLRLATAAAPPV